MNVCILADGRPEPADRRPEPAQNTSCCYTDVTLSILPYIEYPIVSCRILCILLNKELVGRKVEYPEFPALLTYLVTYLVSYLSIYLFSAGDSYQSVVIHWRFLAGTSPELSRSDTLLLEIPTFSATKHLAGTSPENKWAGTNRGAVGRKPLQYQDLGQETGAEPETVEGRQETDKHVLEARTLGPDI